MPSVFISYSHNDGPQANWLAKYLRKSEVTVWLDETGLKIGDLLIEEIAKAIEHTDFVTALLSSNSVKSRWVRKELSFAMTREIDLGKVVVLPIKIDDCELPTYLIDKLYADLSSAQDFGSELRRLAHTLGVDPITWPNLERMYSGTDWVTILMVQSFADRYEWGRRGSYHCWDRQTRLKRILKVYGGYKHPVPESQAMRHIESAIDNIISLDPDILGIGGMGRTSTRIRSGLQEAGFQGKIYHWGADAGKDACEFLQSYGVDPTHW